MAQRTDSSFGLNPLAREFVPVSHSSTQSNGLRGNPRSSGAELASAPTGPDAFEQLPDEVHLCRAERCTPHVASEHLPSTTVGRACGADFSRNSGGQHRHCR